MLQVQSYLQKLLSLMAILLFVSACGLKGDLYMPETESATEPQVVDSTQSEITDQDEVADKVEDSTPAPE